MTDPEEHTTEVWAATAGELADYCLWYRRKHGFMPDLHVEVADVEMSAIHKGSLRSIERTELFGLANRVQVYLILDLGLVGGQHTNYKTDTIVHQDAMVEVLNW